jgi:uncharacterized protein YhhL (DUF1145 family)
MFTLFSKFIVLCGWIYGFLSIFLFEGTIWQDLGRIVLGLMIGIHAVEILIFRKRIEAAEGNTGMHFFQVFLFGLFHIRLLKKK